MTIPFPRWLLTCLCGALAGVSACGKTKKAKDARPVTPVRVKEGTRPVITVFNQHGAVHLQASRSLPPKIAGSVVRTAWASSAGRARARLKKIQVLARRERNHIKYVVDGPSRKSAGRFTADLSLQVPVEADVRVVTTHGKVQVDGVRGRVDVEGGNGDVVVRSAEGAVKITIRKGNISVSGVLTAVEIENGTGDVFLRWKGPDRLKDDSVVRTGKGTVTAKLVSNLNARLNVEAAADRIRSAYPLKHTGKGHAQAVLGEGGKLLVLGVKEGNIKIHRLPFVKPRKFPIKGPPQLRGQPPPRPPRPGEKPRQPRLPHPHHH